MRFPGLTMPFSCLVSRWFEAPFCRFVEVEARGIRSRFADLDPEACSEPVSRATDDKDSREREEGEGS